MKSQDYTDLHKILLSQMIPISLLLFTALCFLLPVFSFAQMEWICATDSAAWSERFFHTSVVFDNKIWVLGGYGGGNDVWFSTDGVNWTCATDSAEWSRRYGHTSVVFDNKMWVLGGYAPICRNDDWFSTDGVNWTCANNSAGWLPRSYHTSIVFDNKIWVLGGYDRYNDVWYSTDGLNWTCATDSASWSRRFGHTSVVFDNKMWVIGGSSGRGEVWYSSDGVNWVCATDSAEWSGRYAHTSVTFGNKIWVIGGGYNDVWYSTGLGIGEERTTLDATRKTPEIYPNPAKSLIRVRYTSSLKGPKDLKLFDISGKLIKEIATLPSVTRNDRQMEMKISLKGINPGIYFIQLGTITQRLIVVR